MDYYLRANTESVLWDKLVEVGAAVANHVKDANGQIVETTYSANTGYAIDVIGTIYKPTGNKIRHTINGADVDLPETLPVEGFHVNLRGPIDLAPKIEYEQYNPTSEDFANSEFLFTSQPAIKSVTPSPIEELLVYPKTPVRVWA